MAARKTKVELEAEINRQQMIIKEQSAKITELLQNAENSFLNSYTYQELQQELKAEKISAQFNKKYIERLEDENVALRAKLAELSSGSPQSKPGRKPTVTDEMRTDIRSMRDAGWSIRDIAEYIGISKSTIHRVLHE